MLSSSTIIRDLQERPLLIQVLPYSTVFFEFSHYQCSLAIVMLLAVYLAGTFRLNLVIAWKDLTGMSRRKQQGCKAKFERADYCCP